MIWHEYKLAIKQADERGNPTLDCSDCPIVARCPTKEAGSRGTVFSALSFFSSIRLGFITDYATRRRRVEDLQLPKNQQSLVNAMKAAGVSPRPGNLYNPLYAASQGYPIKALCDKGKPVEVFVQNT